jgi:hypothetical protein
MLGFSRERLPPLGPSQECLRLRCAAVREKLAVKEKPWGSQGGTGYYFVCGTGILQAALIIEFRILWRTHPGRIWRRALGNGHNSRRVATVLVQAAVKGCVTFAAPGGSPPKIALEGTKVGQNIGGETGGVGVGWCDVVANVVVRSCVGVQEAHWWCQ